MKVEHFGICPLSMAGPADVPLEECTRNCAWFDHDCQRCAIMTIAKNLEEIGAHYYNQNVGEE